MLSNGQVIIKITKLIKLFTKKYKVKPPTYLDRLGLTANEAIAEFNKSRGEDQDRQNYLDALRARRQIQ